MITGPSLIGSRISAASGATERELPAAILPLVTVLRQLSDVVAAMTDEQYQRKPVGVVSSNIGGHVRHCLDHVDALLTGVQSGEINYDHRQRGTDAENNRDAALEAIHRQERALLAFPPRCEHRTLALSAMVSTSLPAVEVETTLGRELAFVLSHTIHHNALIAVMAKMLGVPVPERFGYAVSTIAHLESKACVR